MTHKETLMLHLSNERIRMAAAKRPGEKALRAVWVKQLEKEVAFVEEHFEHSNIAELDKLSDDELMEA